MDEKLYRMGFRKNAGLGEKTQNRQQRAPAAALLPTDSGSLITSVVLALQGSFLWRCPARCLPAVESLPLPQETWSHLLLEALHCSLYPGEDSWRFLFSLGKNTPGHVTHERALELPELDSFCSCPPGRAGWVVCVWGCVGCQVQDRPCCLLRSQGSNLALIIRSLQYPGTRW